MTCLLYELPYMHFLFEYHHILTFLESVPFSSLVCCTASSISGSTIRELPKILGSA